MRNTGLPPTGTKPHFSYQVVNPTVLYVGLADLCKLAHNPFLVVCVSSERDYHFPKYMGEQYKKKPDTFLAIFKHSEGKTLEKES